MRLCGLPKNVCGSNLKLHDAVTIIVFFTCVLLISSAILLQGIERTKYNDDCISFTYALEQLTPQDCVSYLWQFPNMTGQEMIDYHDSKTDRLLEERVYTPEVLTEDKSKRTSAIYKYVDANSDCRIFVKNIKDMEYEIPHMSQRSCIKYIKENSTLTGQEMIDRHWEKIFKTPLNVCRFFTSALEQLTPQDCVSYLRQFPNITEQEMMDYHNSKTDRLLEERVYTPEVLTEDKSKNTPNSACIVFVKNIKDIEYEMPYIISVQDCIKHLKENSTLTGQEMIDRHLEKILNNPVYMNE